MKRLEIIVLMIVSLPIYSKSQPISHEKELNVVLAYIEPESSDKESKESIKEYKKAFNNVFSKTDRRWYNKLGIQFEEVEDPTFFEEYGIDPMIPLPAILFFKRIKFLPEETISIDHDTLISKELINKFSSSESQVGKLVKQLSEEYKEHQEELEVARQENMMYLDPRVSYYNGYYSPIGYYNDPFWGGYGGYGFGWSSGWGHGYHHHRRCH